MLPSYARQVVTRVRPAWVEDAHGNQVKDWENADRVTVAGCSVQPGETREELDGREAVSTRWTVFAPPGSDFRATDGVEVEGRLYAVNGEPQRWSSPTGRLDHVVLTLVDWAG